MFSAFHYNSNRGDRRFRQMYKSGEKRSEWNRDLTFEDSISRARNNRQLLVEKFRQIQSQLTEETDEHQSAKSNDEDSSQETFLAPKESASSSRKDSPSFKDLGLPSSKAVSIGTSSTRSKPRASVSAFDSNSCEGFDYSSSFKNNLGDNFTFNMENYNCSTEDLFDKSYQLDTTARERLRNEVWNFETGDFNWKFDEMDKDLLCPGCNQSYMKLKDSSLLCHNCTLQIDLSSSSISIEMIKEKLKQKLDQHRQNCKERVKYKFKDEKMFIGCKHCKTEYYIS